MDKGMCRAIMATLQSFTHSHSFAFNTMPYCTSADLN